ncbi:protein NKG7-like [Pelodiscus sinensis]|uniref:protein NKG7-like n=1 Tax=Pelodiscus sinensis TaxID=13735 RepID=UPI003F6CEB3F
MLPLQIPSVALVLLSLLLLLVALGSDYWRVASTGPQSFHEGLWKSCVDSVCEQISSASDSLTVIRAFTLLAAIAGCLSCFVLLASFLRSHLRSVPLALLSFLASFTAGFCALVAMAMYTGEFSEAVNATQFIFGWSFGLGWAACPLFLLAGVVTLVAHRSS